MAIHDEILTTALRLCRERKGWTFRVLEIVRALPHLNQNSVRTHVVSRLCVNAPKHHPHKWDYFLRKGRGVYEIRPPYRRRTPSARSTTTGVRSRKLAKPLATYGPTERSPRDTIHVAVSRSGGFYVADCLEVAVVTQGRTLDELVGNLREAIALHLEGEAPRQLGLVRKPRVAISYELTADDVALA